MERARSHLQADEMRHLWVDEQVDVQFEKEQGSMSLWVEGTKVPERAED